MGHQVYIISRVRSKANGATIASPSRYRCVAAMHAQEVSGGLRTVQATHRLLKLIKVPLNNKIIQHELSAIQGIWEPNAPIPVNEEDRQTFAPCPFIASVLHSSWNLALDEGEEPIIPVFSSSVEIILLDPNMMSKEGESDDGITVIDISEPFSPAYCHVSVSDPEATQLNVSSMTPLTAEEYARAYHPSNTTKMHITDDGEIPENDFQKSIAALACEKVLTLQALAEAWPSEYEVAASGPEKKKRKTEKAKAKAETVEVEMTNPEGRATRSSTRQKNGPVNTQVAATTEPAVEQKPTGTEDKTMKALKKFLVEGADLTDLDKILKSAVDVALVRTTFAKLSPLPATAIPVLLHVLNTEIQLKAVSADELNLSHLPLSSAQVLSVLDAFPAVECLDLSHNPLVDCRTVKIVLSSTPTLRRLVLLACPALTDSALSTLLLKQPYLFINLSSLIHPLFLCLSPTFSLPPTHAFSIAGSSFNNDKPYSVSVPYFSASTAVRAITDLVSPYLSSEHENTCLLQSPLQPATLSEIMARAGGISATGEETKWSERSIVILPKLNKKVVKAGYMFIMSMYMPLPGSPGLTSGYAFLDFTSETSNSSPPNKARPAAPRNYEGTFSFMLPHLQAEARSGSSSSSAAQYRVLDLRAFLERMQERDPAREPVDEASVRKLEDMLRRMERRIRGVSMFSSEDVANFFEGPMAQRRWR